MRDFHGPGGALLAIQGISGIQWLMASYNLIRRPNYKIWYTLELNFVGGPKFETPVGKLCTRPWTHLRVSLLKSHEIKNQQSKSATLYWFNFRCTARSC